MDTMYHLIGLIYGVCALVLMPLVPHMLVSPAGRRRLTFRLIATCSVAVINAGVRGVRGGSVCGAEGQTHWGPLCVCVCVGMFRHVSDMSVCLVKFI